MENPPDEWDAIALNYTSGTTGDPKGVVYHHRGAYLNALSNILTGAFRSIRVYLWTLPMFHCNGWCFPWTIAERAGTNVCLRRVEAEAIWDAFRAHRVTHLCGAPIVYSTIINAPAEKRAGVAHPIQGQIAGAAPPSVVHRGRGAGGHHAYPRLWPAMLRDSRARKTDRRRCPGLPDGRLFS